MSESNEQHLNRVFRHIAKEIPNMKENKRKLKQKAFLDGVERKAHAPLPCKICAGIFDPFAGTFKKPFVYCETCRKALEDGYTAFVTKDRKRYAITRFPQSTPEQQARVAGKVIEITNEQMNKIAGNKAAEN